jgi:hypothetical protein
LADELEIIHMRMAKGVGEFPSVVTARQDKATWVSFKRNSTCIMQNTVQPLAPVVASLH